jgi:UDP-N-acetylmuramyl pentapeptide phosphotransferase/UDP-N-acetylglucosamine-1-phosphate transferase
MFIIFLYISVISIALIFIQSKYLFLVDAPREQTHKSKYNKNTPLIGGIYMFITMATFMPYIEHSSNSLLMTAFLFSLLILGVFSDLKKNFSPKLRLILQSSLVLIFIFLLKLKINRTGFFFLEYFIDNAIFNLFFTSLCIIILINGSNFCDGVNCNVIGYYLIVALSIFFMELPKPTILPDIKIIIIIFSIFYLVNLFQKSFLGDNGVYVTTVFMGVYVINFINLNSNVSPLLALNLLWYPAFENLFSIIRRLNANRTVDVADGLHFHTLLLKKIFYFNKNFFLSNSFAGVLINLFMFMGIFLSINYYDDTKILTLILMLNILIYVLVYFIFLTRKSKFKSHQ